MDFKMTPQDAWTSAWIFGVLGVALLIPLSILFRPPQFQRAGWALTVASALFWGSLAMVAIFFFWGFYYRYFYPAWGRWLAPLDFLFYAAVGFGMWWLASRLPGAPVVWFALLGGLEGVAEHLIGIYALHILEKVPWLQGMPAVPVKVELDGATEFVLLLDDGGDGISCDEADWVEAQVIQRGTNCDPKRLVPQQENCGVKNTYAPLMFAWALHFKEVATRGPTALSAAERWAERFRTDPTVMYRRTTRDVAINEDWGLAEELGNWRGTYTTEGVLVHASGVYAAKWQRAEGGEWLLQAELFTTITCTGAEEGCRPPDPIHR